MAAISLIFFFFFLPLFIYTRFVSATTPNRPPLVEADESCSRVVALLQTLILLKEASVGYD